MQVIAVDGMGGDFAPGEIVKGCVLALNSDPQLRIILTGNEAMLSEQLNGESFDSSRLEIRHSSEIISSSDSPVQAIRTKKDSSLVSAMKAVADKEAGAVISCGSTGAVLAGATFIIKRIDGIKRPALAPLMPTVDGKGVLLIDCGANVDCKPAYLEQFALMGSIYMERLLGRKSPRVGLLNNGTESEKGNELVKETYAILNKMKNINFVGNCEARDAITGQFDVIVADGFVGNIMMKTLEGTAVALMKMLKKELMSSARSKLGAMLAMPALENLKRSMDYEAYGGAPLLGVDGGVIKSHGDSKASTLASAIAQGVSYINSDITKVIRSGISY